jgi:hypothetical protein
MPRLIDDIRARGVQMPRFVEREWEASWTRYAKNIMQVLQTEAAGVVDRQCSGLLRWPQEYWSLERDFPNLAPPYECFWVEHRLTRRIHSDTKGDTDMSSVLGKEARMGVAFMAIEPKDARGEDIPENTRWIYWADIFIQYDHVHGDRALARAPLLALRPGPRARRPDAVLCTSGIRRGDGPDDVATSALLAICFLHCKNVVVSDEVCQAAGQKHRTGQWPTTYRHW